jgi:hypothetical protein
LYNTDKDYNLQAGMFFLGDMKTILAKQTWANQTFLFLFGLQNGTSSLFLKKFKSIKISKKLDY